MRLLYLFSSDIELHAAFPDGAPAGLPVAVTGVGLVDAAIGAVRAIERHRPAAVVFLGTCGAHRGSGLAIGDLVVASGASLGSGDVVGGRMRLPEILCSRLQTDEVLSGRFTDVMASAGTSPCNAWVSCTLGITEDDDLAALLHEQEHAGVENLELFPVLRAAEDIPATALLGVTNIVGVGGGADWRANFRAEMLRLGRIVTEMERKHASSPLE